MTATPLDVAENLLAQADGDAGFRAAASRAYYAAFQHILAHPKLTGYQRSRTGEDHRLLIEYLKKSSDPALKKLGISYLPRLRAIRNEADYETSIHFTHEMADEALERATEIITGFLPS